MIFRASKIPTRGRNSGTKLKGIANVLTNNLQLYKSFSSQGRMLHSVVLVVHLLERLQRHSDIDNLSSQTNTCTMGVQNLCTPICSELSFFSHILAQIADWLKT
jgi:hypothetical protein